MAFAPFGYALRAVRDSALRADAIGLNVKGVQWAAFIVAGLFAGLAGALYVFSKGSTSPEVITVGKSVDGLVMVLLGGIRSEEHTSELQSLMRNSYAVFCLKKKISEQ